MKKTFAAELLKQARTNKDIFVLTGDLGFGVWDQFRDGLPDRFLNCGASEQAMMGIAVGLVLEGKIPFVYSITPFLLWRPAETIRLYIGHENIGVKLVAAGRDDDYSKSDGFSHDAKDAGDFLSLFPNIKQLWPEDKSQIETLVELMITDPSPYFISLRR